MALGGGAADVVNDELIARLLQIGGHAGAHCAEPDKSDFHNVLLSKRPLPCPSPREGGEGTRLKGRFKIVDECTRTTPCSPSPRVRGEGRGEGLSLSCLPFRENILRDLRR